jgi:hypothetical protein
MAAVAQNAVKGTAASTPVDAAAAIGARDASFAFVQELAPELSSG